MSSWPQIAHPGEPSSAGISGGRTSGMMAYLLPEDTILIFANTGKEHEATYDFLRQIEDDLGRPIVRLEWRSPPKGEPPRKASFEVVAHDTMARRGEPFIEMLSALQAYRKEHKGLGPVAPWARSRICTAYLKIKTQKKYMRSLGHETHTQFTGLRADEPDRVSRLKASARRDVDDRAPLFELGVTKADVLAFWDRKPFDLAIPEYLGNCDACFMKDERDLATALVTPETDPGFWIGIEERFGPMRRGRPSYEQVLAEAPDRMRIRQQLREGQEPTAGSLGPRRFRLVVRQEKKPAAPWSCACEAAMVATDEDFDAHVLESP